MEPLAMPSLAMPCNFWTIKTATSLFLLAITGRKVKVWLEFSARAAARRRGISEFRPLLSRTRRNLAVAIQRRLIDQVRACLPHDAGILDGICRELDEAANDYPYPGSGQLNTSTLP